MIVERPKRGRCYTHSLSDGDRKLSFILQTSLAGWVGGVCVHDFAVSGYVIIRKRAGTLQKETYDKCVDRLISMGSIVRMPVLKIRRISKLKGEVVGLLSSNGNEHIGIMTDFSDLSVEIQDVGLAGGLEKKRRILGTEVMRLAWKSSYHRGLSMLMRRDK
jgi:hypothetical protein